VYSGGIRSLSFFLLSVLLSVRYVPLPVWWEERGVTTDEFDPDRLKLGVPSAIPPDVPDKAVPEQKVELTSLGGRRGGQYVPGVPIELFDRACVLPGKALAVYLLLWRQSRIEKRATVVLTSAGLEQHGIRRHAKEMALSHLEEAGLVSVRRRVRRNPEVMLLRLPGSSDRKGGAA
jgi:hypothetical protein